MTPPGLGALELGPERQELYDAARDVVILARPSTSGVFITHDVFFRLGRAVTLLSTKRGAQERLASKAQTPAIRRA